MSEDTRTRRVGKVAVRSELMKAARELFARDGYESTNVNDITKAAGTSVGTLYYYFGGKSDLLLAIYSDYMEHQETRVRDAIKLVHQAGVTDGRQLFLAGTRAYLAGSWVDRDVVQIVGGDPAPREFADASSRASTRWNERNAALLGLEGETVTARTMLSAISGAIANWTRDLAACSTREEAETYIDEAVLVFGRMFELNAPRD
jgi:AcrR family transcriptional regulator